MTKWFAWFQAVKSSQEVEGTAPVFRLIAADDLDTAVVIARELAERDKVSFIGVTIAPEKFNPPDERVASGKRE